MEKNTSTSATSNQPSLQQLKARLNQTFKSDVDFEWKKNCGYFMLRSCTILGSKWIESIFRQKTTFWNVKPADFEKYYNAALDAQLTVGTIGYDDYLKTLPKEKNGDTKTKTT